MTFTLVILLYIYFAFLFFWAILSLIGLFNLVRFGGAMFGTFLIGFIYLAGTICIIFLSYTYLSPIHWQTEATIFGNITLFKNVVDSPSFLK